MKYGFIPAMLTFCLLPARPAPADPVVVGFDMPSLDRWFYPFNADPGSKIEISVFGGLTSSGFDPSFDNRDGQMLIGFDVARQLDAGLGVDHYNVKGLTVRVTVESSETFSYDATIDPWQSWLPQDDPESVADPDPGRPVELFGAGFRNGWTATTFQEDGPFCAACSCFPPNSCVAVRNVFPLDFDGSCAPRDVSNNVTEEFDPVPFAVGTTTAVSEGQPVPSGTVMSFEVDVADACIQEYLRGAMDEGVLDLVVASIFPAEKQQEGTFPKFYAKENILVPGVVDAAQLDLVVVTGPIGDLDGDGIVGITDFLDLLKSWGPCAEPCPPACAADLDNDCIVGVVDFLILLANWTA